MRLKPAAAAFALLLPAALPAQVIRGVVLDEAGSGPLAGVKVELIAAGAVLDSVRTNPLGWFQLKPAEAGNYLLRTSHPFYAEGRTDAVTVGAHETVTVMVRMVRAPVQLEPLIVTARSRNPLQRFRMRMDEGKDGRFVKRDFIQARVASPPSALLRMTIGVQLVRSESAIPTNSIVLRGYGGACAANVFLDGLPVPSDPDFTIDQLTGADLIEGIEIYDIVDRIPLEYAHRENMNCGVVAYWTRPEVRRPFRWIQLALFAAGAGFMYMLTQQR